MHLVSPSLFNRRAHTTFSKIGFVLPNCMRAVEPSFSISDVPANLPICRVRCAPRDVFAQRNGMNVPFPNEMKGRIPIFTFSALRASV
jgi:hypothetical protein